MSLEPLLLREDEQQNTSKEMREQSKQMRAMKMDTTMTGLFLREAGAVLVNEDILKLPLLLPPPLLEMLLRWALLAGALALMVALLRFLSCALGATCTLGAVCPLGAEALPIVLEEATDPV